MKRKMVSASCHKCGRKGKCWSYRSACKKYNLHVECVLEMSVENWHEYFGRGNGSSWELETRIPSLNNTALQTHHQKGKWKKVKKWCKLARVAVQIVISTVLGDPTSLFAGVIGSLSSHPQHKLKFEYSEFPLKCDGCKEVGIGSSYRCAAFCDFDLHMHCAIPSPSICHAFYSKCSFKFLPLPPGDMARYCNACEKDVTGFVYHCEGCGFDLHPCCAKLPMVLDDGEGGAGVACVREMLVENWHELYFERGNGSSRKLETRIPSLKNTLQTPHQMGKGKKVKKFCKMVRLALQFVISVVLGDPTVFIAGVIGSLMST
ncbi:hypothetical protein SLEP1_g32957 [Rubroshorea leprosula]|uniref:DC1 domain-containing protein n=1 Tax=Rubroshorea leprosula TaxID=152421 RepID=A0AAV5KF25_9ROSI|nr:hypothetical protein SLEP1_g32957 [Rubroshorea leprosula]